MRGTDSIASPPLIHFPARKVISIEMRARDTRKIHMRKDRNATSEASTCDDPGERMLHMQMNESNRALRH
jgi:hypothetical protein